MDDQQQWYIERMDAVRLYFPDPDIEALPLSEGRYGIGWRDGLPCLVDAQADALIVLNMQHGGIWMSVVNTNAWVHLNGRRVYRIALVRSGDVIHLDSATLHLRSAARALPEHTVPAPTATNDDPRLVLRAIGGPDHGRCFTIGRPCLVGTANHADVQVDGPDCGERHAWLERVQQQVLLRHATPSARSLVNGEPVHEAMLAAGDQVAFSPRHRFVLEAPYTPAAAPQPQLAAPPPLVFPPPRRLLRSLLWLLSAAVLLALALAGVLLLAPV